MKLTVTNHQYRGRNIEAIQPESGQTSYNVSAYSFDSMSAAKGFVDGVIESSLNQLSEKRDRAIAKGKMTVARRLARIIKAYEAA
jgi:hypothetical protein